MRTTRELPSSVTDSTVPVPSTWPCMTWPPSRSPARSGSSRFTSSPSESGSSDVRRSVSGITSASALARAFGGDYLSTFVDIPVVLTALLLLALIAAVNLRGIAESVRINVGFTLVEITGLILIVIIAAVALGQGDAERLLASLKGMAESNGLKLGDAMQPIRVALTGPIGSPMLLLWPKAPLRAVPE